jgi:putative DNA primase/helicase
MTAHEIARHLPIERVIGERGIKLHGKIELAGGCPHCGGRDRFAINTRKQKWNCRGCRKGGGDAISLVQFLDGCDFATALTVLAGEALSGSIGRPRRVAKGGHSFDSTGDYERRQRDKARRLWRASQEATGTPVGFYLRSIRGITVTLPATVRFLPPLKPGHHPAMIVPYGMVDEPEPGILAVAEAKLTAVHLVLLKADGSGKADVKPNKITIASPAGMPMVLAPPNDLLGLAICEGVEDALSVHEATGLGAWASGGAAFMPKIADAVPEYIEAVTVYMHDDDDGQRRARELASALVACGIEVRLEGMTP